MGNNLRQGCVFWGNNLHDAKQKSRPGEYCWQIPDNHKYLVVFGTTTPQEHSDRIYVKVEERTRMAMAMGLTRTTYFTESTELREQVECSDRTCPPMLFAKIRNTLLKTYLEPEREP
jgi:hypothetical protein